MRRVIILCLVATFFVANVLAAPPSNCQPGKWYNVDCNNCVCGADGKLACTLKLCLKKRSASPDVNSCTPTEEKTIANGCNHCVCSRLRKWECTETNLDRCRETPHITNFFRRKREELGKTCTPGEIKTTGNGCNYCRCLPEGQWACIDGNLEQCLKQQKANANRQKRERECEYGQNKQDNCNTCFCVKGGNWACTRRACLSTEEVRSHGPPAEQGSFGPPQDQFNHGPPPDGSIIRV